MPSGAGAGRWHATADRGAHSRPTAPCTTWQQREGRLLTVEGYRRTGRIRHAVATTAEQVHDGLDSAARAAAPWVFVQLVHVDDRIGDPFDDRIGDPAADGPGGGTADRLRDRIGDRARHLVRRPIEAGADQWAAGGGEPDLLYGAHPAGGRPGSRHRPARPGPPAPDRGHRRPGPPRRRRVRGPARPEGWPDGRRPATGGSHGGRSYGCGT
ncbi:hypothetical protein [Streptomyces sp. WAC06614]|uniref:nSTAND1 domain-containing NTPase n=1 Tax=Streptomyces sp. WAC06614 TaxID=2487416 RepID=UPI0034D96AE3